MQRVSMRRSDRASPVACRTILSAVALMAILSGGPRKAWGQDAAPTASPDADAVERGKVELQADKLEYDRPNKVVEAIGNVVIVKGDESLTAEYVRFHTDSELARAVGSVVVTRGESVWRGPSLTYNFKTGEGLAPRGSGSAKPFKIKSERSKRMASGAVRLEHAEVTTCDLDDGHWHYHVSGKTVEVQPGDYVKLWGGVWRFGPVPVLYVPYWYRNLEDDFGWSFYPGHSSRMGTFLLSSYRYRLNAGLRGRSHVDYRSKRGIGLGQDFMWNVGDSEWKGTSKAYVIDDKEPLDEDDDPALSDIESTRYRIKVENIYAPTIADTIRVRGHYLSDTDILEDFFEDEFRQERQPDNYMTYTHRGDTYSASILFRARLNDFYDSVNRLPEFTLDLFSRPLNVAGLFYDSESTATSLERVFAEPTDQEENSTLRLDTRHTLLRPDKHFGFLVVIPRIGLRGTYYSETKQETTATVVETTTELEEIVSASGATNVVVRSTTETNAVTTVSDAGSDFRSSVEFGLETSFKAFKIWQSPAGRKYRHIVEPFANWTYIPEPSLLPNELYQFDSVDGLSEAHFIRFGVRNKLQTKRSRAYSRINAYRMQERQRVDTETSEVLEREVETVEKGSESVPLDLVDAEVFTVYRIERESGEDAVEDIFWDVELRPSEWLAFDFDGNWDLVENQVERFNAEAIVAPEKRYRARMEYRYRVDDSSLLYSDLTLFPMAPWSCNIYGRYEFEESRVEEEGGYIQRRLDCLSLRIGLNYIPGDTRSDGSERDDEYKVLFELWLNAFPEATLAGKHRG